ncbi:MAG TPA: hypothetical protein VM820_07650 [Vicinamibacterales bacterium]|nr:hypothetical protein [Vicinamibacterales bacterium]
MHPETSGSVAETAVPLCANVTVTGPEHPPPPSISSQITLAVPDHVPLSLAAGSSEVGVVGVVELPEPQATTVSPASATRVPAWRRREIETEDRMAASSTVMAASSTVRWRDKRPQRTMN